MASRTLGSNNETVEGRSLEETVSKKWKQIERYGPNTRVLMEAVSEAVNKDPMAWCSILDQNHIVVKGLNRFLASRIAKVTTKRAQESDLLPSHSPEMNGNDRVSIERDDNSEAMSPMLPQLPAAPLSKPRKLMPGTVDVYLSDSDDDEAPKDAPAAWPMPKSELTRLGFILDAVHEKKFGWFLLKRPNREPDQPQASNHIQTNSVISVASEPDAACAASSKEVVQQMEPPEILAGANQGTQEVSDAAATLPPNQCSICKKIFAKPGNVKRHMQSHSSMRVQCSWVGCGKDFADKQNLRDHIRAVHERVKYSCPYCPIKCSDQRAINRHIKYQHAKEYEESKEEEVEEDY